MLPTLPCVRTPAICMLYTQNITFRRQRSNSAAIAKVIVKSLKSPYWALLTSACDQRLNTPDQVCQWQWRMQTQVCSQFLTHHFSQACEKIRRTRVYQQWVGEMPGPKQYHDLQSICQHEVHQSTMAQVHHRQHPAMRLLIWVVKHQRALLPLFMPWCTHYPSYCSCGAGTVYKICTAHPLLTVNQICQKVKLYTGAGSSDSSVQDSRPDGDKKTN